MQPPSSPGAPQPPTSPQAPGTSPSDTQPPALPAASAPPLSAPAISTGPATPSAEARTSRLAWASLLLAPLGLLILPAIASIACGIAAFTQISRSQGRLKGNGLALAGIIVSGCMILLLPFLAIGAGLLLPALANAKGKAQTIQSVNNVKMLCLGVRLFVTDHQEKFPASETWCDELTSYVNNPINFRRPNDPTGARCGYAYNDAVAGLKESEVNPATVIIYETEQGSWNLSGGDELLRQSRRGGDPVVVGFADGHVEQVSAGRISQLRWEP